MDTKAEELLIALKEGKIDSKAVGYTDAVKALLSTGVSRM